MTPAAFQAVSGALDVLLDQSWPGAGHGQRTDQIAAAATDEQFQEGVALLFAQVHGVHPEAHFWVKDAQSRFLAVCPNLLAASGLDSETLLSGINDVDGRLPWMRQGPVYVRDDRAVFLSGVAKLDIVERQDRGDETIWLKTSKVPYTISGTSLGGTVGGFQQISAKGAWKLHVRADET